MVEGEKFSTHIAAIMPPMKVAPSKKRSGCQLNGLGAVRGNKIRTKRILNIDLHHERTADGQTKKHREAVYRKGLILVCGLHDNISEFMSDS